ncbi:Cupredoxin [Crassisporium funariophilum]|nr:Cupredoxin [Crassisporium funariophilum]
MLTLALRLAALAALPLVLSQNIIDVQVGAGGNIAYDPEFVTAHPGDIINFIFVPVPAGTSPLPNRQFTVPEGTAPIWFYCGQTGHCAQGMVFAINPQADPSPRSFSAFKALAMGGTPPPSATPPASTFSTPPPQPWQSATATVTFGGSTYTTTYTSYAGTPPPTPAAVPVDHKILVGDGGALSYSPANITAAIGDTVTFEFHPKNHTVTQSSFSNPCQAVNGGFKSGFRPVAADATDFPLFQIKINDTAPIWGYCGQTNHCSAGMVFAINAVESGPNNFAAFTQIAKNSATGSGGNGSNTPTTSTAPPANTSTGAALSIAAGYGFTSVLAMLGIVAAAL